VIPLPVDPKKIRNFSIIAHIDHGKSTLADRLLQKSGAITEREMQAQLLDDMDLERERGITIKASAVAINYKYKGEDYLFNLIDTPGHVDFTYEVSRSLAACEGAILVVDATQGVQAQTVANAYLAVESNCEIIPVVNKIDLASARPEEVAEEMERVLGLSAADAIFISGKTGLNVEQVFERVVERVPPPPGDPNAPTRALIFDSVFDDYRGVIVFVRLVDGVLRPGQKIILMGAGRQYVVNEVGKLKPKMAKVSELSAGEVGYIVATIKTLGDVRIGDTVTDAAAPAPAPLPGYEPPLQMVFCDFYPGGDTQYPQLREALDKLKLNDSSFTFVPETSEALGFGFRCGFLGLLHMEIIQERLERESKIEVVQTAPSVTYEIETRDGTVKKIDNPGQLPDPSNIKEIREPIVKASIITPADYIGGVMTLCEERRGAYQKTEYISPQRVILEYEFPLAEIIYDFFDKLKSLTRGYGTMNYALKGFRADDLCKVDILVAGKRVEPLSFIVHRSNSEQRGRRVLARLRKEIPRQLFEVALQAAIGGKIIARENIKSVGKNVTAKCYGGDITRKRKLLEKQKEGKKRMKNIGNIEVPQEAFMAVLETGDVGDDED
jgi:GTP-binding protein LepA